MRRKRKGHTPWNKGKHWDELGIAEESRRHILDNLMRVCAKPNERRRGIPVSSYDGQGTLVKSYESVASAARDMGVTPRAIHKACKKGYLSVGLRWKLTQKEHVLSEEKKKHRSKKDSGK